MSLTISIWNSEGTPVDELAGDVSFGFERFRFELWGTEAVRDCGALLIPLLADQDLYVDYRQLDVLEADAHRLKEAAPAIADRLSTWRGRAKESWLFRKASWVPYTMLGEASARPGW